MSNRYKFRGVRNHALELREFLENSNGEWLWRQVVILEILSSHSSKQTQQNLLVLFPGGALFYFFLLFFFFYDYRAGAVQNSWSPCLHFLSVGLYHSSQLTETLSKENIHTRPSPWHCYRSVQTHVCLVPATVIIPPFSLLTFLQRDFHIIIFLVIFILKK